MQVTTEVVRARTEVVQATAEVLEVLTKLGRAATEVAGVRTEAGRAAIEVAEAGADLTTAAAGVRSSMTPMPVVTHVEFEPRTRTTEQIRRTARINLLFVREAFSSVGASPHVQAVIGNTPDELHQ